MHNTLHAYQNRRLLGNETIRRETAHADGSDSSFDLGRFKSELSDREFNRLAQVTWLSSTLSIGFASRLVSNTLQHPRPRARPPSAPALAPSPAGTRHTTRLENWSVAHQGSDPQRDCVSSGYPHAVQTGPVSPIGGIHSSMQLAKIRGCNSLRRFSHPRRCRGHRER